MAITEFRSAKAEAIVEGYRIVKPGSADYTVVKATAATDKSIGTADSLDKAAGEMVDMGVGDVHEVRLGGTVTRGDALTSDANGKAITTTTVGHRAIGFAEQSGVLDDVITYLRAPHVV